LRPPALLAAREQYKQGALPGEALRQLEDDAIRAAVTLQEDVGLQVATDGEYRRELWHMDFLPQFGHAEMYEAGIQIKFHSEQGDIDFAPPGIRVVGKLSRPEKRAASLSPLICAMLSPDKTTIVRATVQGGGVPPMCIGLSACV
jgi:5-methyltetrahydropteroyltriglutamate--homocysteine methyltransferase